MYDISMTQTQIDSLIKAHENKEAFAPLKVTISEVEQNLWVRFKIDPQRFLPTIFDGDWAHIKQHPELGEIRVVKVITGSDGITRAIARQGNKIYAYPWFS